MSDRRQFKVIKADNGFIVKVINHGLSPLKEPYEKSLLVFESQVAMTEWINNFFISGGGK